MKLQHLTHLNAASAFERAGSWRRPYLWIALACFAFVVPAIVLRSAHFEEGTTIALARGAFEDGHWLAPYNYGMRFIERPALFSWLLGAIGLVTGAMPVWLARIPVALALLGSSWLIFYLVRQTASAAAGLFGVACFLTSPLVLEKVFTAETDLFVAAMVFAAFVVVWDGERSGGGSAARWALTGAVLSVAVLVKGAPPLGFFFIGLGAYFLLRRRWIEFVKLGLVGLLPAMTLAAWYWSVYQAGDGMFWMAYNRLNPISWGEWLSNVARFFGQAVLAFLPGWPLAAAVAVRAAASPSRRDNDVVLALILYAGLCTFLLAMWPGARGRYALPAILAVAAAAGIAFDRLRADYPRLINATGLAIGALALYRLAANWVAMPLVPDAFQKSRHYGEAIAAAVATRPGTVFVTHEAIEADLFVYVPYRVRFAQPDGLATIDGPFWAVLTPQQQERLQAKLGANSRIVVHVESNWPFAWRLLDIRKN